MLNFNKQLTFWILRGFTVAPTLLALPRVTSAQSENYEPLEPVPFLVNNNGRIDITSPDSLVTYANTIIQIMIGLAILLAVIMVIVGGVSYMTTGSFTKKSDAKERMTQALLGLLLALSSVAILNTINPNLTEIKELEDIILEETEIEGPEFGITPNPDGTGLFYCYNTSDGNKCADTLAKCQEVQPVDEDAESECKKTVYYEGAFDIADGDQACFGYSERGTPGISCFPSQSQCDDSRNDAENSWTDKNPETECKAPVDFGSNGGGEELQAREFACPRGDDDITDPCPTEDRQTCEDCDTFASFNLVNHFRPEPNLCHDDYAVIDGNQCEINSDLSNKLQDFKDNLDDQSVDVFWRFTEAWPPTLRHASPCHAVGTCVDIALRQNSDGDRWVNSIESATPKHVNQINAFIAAAENAGLSVTYEVGSEALMNFLTSGDPSVPSDKIINIGVAPHFSVYRSDADR